MDFKPINTQEEFDTAIKDRLARERDSLQRKYADYDDLKQKATAYDTEKSAHEQAIAAANTKISDYETQIGDLNKKIKGYETDSVKTRIALELGLPFELRSRINGETEDDIRKDAEGLAKLIGKQKNPPPPLKGTESEVDGEDAAYKKLRENLLLKGD